MKIDVDGVITNIVHESDKSFIFSLHVHNDNEDYEILCTLNNKKRSLANGLEIGQKVNAKGVLVMYKRNTKTGTKVHINGFFVKQIDVI